MKYIGLMDTSIMSFNQGDNIIMESTKYQLNDILKDNFVIKIPTHSPAFKRYEIMPIPGSKNILYNNIQRCNIKFICGTNLLENNMMRRQSTWDIKLKESKYLNGCVLVGVGAGRYGKVNYYTKRILLNSLSNKYIHSVRDEEAKKILEDIGLKAINTGCATLWGFDKEKCKKIETKKSENVVITLTDYKKDELMDQKLIDIINKNYKNVYFWIQGSEDLEYLKSFKNTENIKLIPPSVEEYQKFLENTQCDFVGTRLHAGIKAMQNNRRTIILIVDNRARSIKRDNNIVAIERNEIENLEAMINSEFKTEIKIDINKINKWKNQFLDK